MHAPVPDDQLLAMALILAVIVQEKPLSEEMIEVAAGKAEVPEY